MPQGFGWIGVGRTGEAMVMRLVQHGARVKVGLQS
jgi:hypothetical protein